MLLVSSLTSSKHYRGHLSSEFLLFPPSHSPFLSSEGLHLFRWAINHCCAVKRSEEGFLLPWQLPQRCTRARHGPIKSYSEVLRSNRRPEKCCATCSSVRNFSTLLCLHFHLFIQEHNLKVMKIKCAFIITSPFFYNSAVHLI